jgi:hypothetical protein
MLHQQQSQMELKMTLDEFRKSLTATEPPAGLTHALTGLWWDGKGDWKRAHESAQRDEGSAGSWVHAICISRKAIRATPPIGTAVLAACLPGAAGRGVAEQR